MDKKDYKNTLEILLIYNNYIHSLETRKEYGILYGDTDELIQDYENKLKEKNIKIIKKKTINKYF